MQEERRGLRLAFNARAEVAPEGSPGKTVVGTVTSLSLNGCFIQISASFPSNALISVKILQEGASFEGKARVVHVQAGSGIGISFREVRPYSQSVLQKWILAAMRGQPPKSNPPGA